MTELNLLYAYSHIHRARQHHGRPYSCSWFQAGYIPFSFVLLAALIATKAVAFVPYPVAPPLPSSPTTTTALDRITTSALTEAHQSSPLTAPSVPIWPMELEQETSSYKPQQQQQQHLVGIIGGIGPAASIRFHSQQLRLEKDRQKRRSQNYCLGGGGGGTCGFLADVDNTPYLLYHNPHIPNNNLAVLGQGPPSVQALIDSAHALQRAGADEVAFACTTAYHWMAAVEEIAKVPVLDLSDQVARRVKAKGHNRVGLLDVDGTIHSGAFHQALERQGIEMILPDAMDQGVIMTSVATIKAEGLPVVDRDTRVHLEQVARCMVKRGGVTAIILGCTEIATALGGRAEEIGAVEIIDTLDVLADCIVHSDQMQWRGLGALDSKLPSMPLPQLDSEKSTVLLAQ